jgi:hypothetical protein
MKELELTAKKIFEAVEHNLLLRRGISYELERLDEDIRKELREENLALIIKVLEKEIAAQKVEDK